MSVLVESLLNLIWIDKNVDSEENIQYYNDLYNTIIYNSKEYKYFYYKKCLTFAEAINYIKNIKFQATIIIISESLYYEFIEQFIKNLNNIFIIPKIIIFTTNNYELLLKNDKRHNLLNNKFYNFDAIKTSYP